MDNIINDLSLASDERIQELLNEAEKELNKIEPKIEYLENLLTELTELKHKKNKLLSLKASLKSLLNQNDLNLISVNQRNKNVTINTGNNTFIEHKTLNIQGLTNVQSGVTFLPELALDEVKPLLRANNNLNYEIYKAVIFNGGEARTDQIKEYLVNNKIKQPKTGKTFNNVDLKDISSRVNYLVRKNILTSIAPGTFRSNYGFKSLVDS